MGLRCLHAMRERFLMMNLWKLPRLLLKLRNLNCKVKLWMTTEKGGREMAKGDSDLGENGEETRVKQAVFSYGEKERERFNRILSYYVGTHNFHNSTTSTKAEDPSARRYIISFEANTVVTVEGIDFVKCEVVGQSFMLHQICKMIGACRGCPPSLYLKKLFRSKHLSKYLHSHEELSMKAYEEEAEDFKMKQIYSHIASTEQKEGAVALWLHSLNHRNPPDLHNANEDVPIDGESAQADNLAE
ncbi:Pseudouridine synthase I, TruA, alpha/beta domain [Dillenia turbinata]|uniref:tRNA pseudouridine synthase n=1 Tax=Dillenia turbinata TaxID=194707 RepID=A0AAN8W504_9MAGN